MECPACRAPGEESDLKPNHALEVVVGAHALWEAKQSDQKGLQVWLCFTVLWTIAFKSGQDFW